MHNLNKAPTAMHNRKPHALNDLAHKWLTEYPSKKNFNMHKRQLLRWHLILAVLALVALLPAPSPAEPTQIAEIKRDSQVDFEKEILPIFRRNCLACHSATEAQSDLVLES